MHLTGGTVSCTTSNEGKATPTKSKDASAERYTSKISVPMVIHETPNSAGSNSNRSQDRKVNPRLSDFNRQAFSTQGLQLMRKDKIGLLDETETLKEISNQDLKEDFNRTTMSVGQQINESSI